MASIFDAADEHQETTDRSYFPPGFDGIVKVVRCEQRMGRPTPDPSYVAELEVVEGNTLPTGHRAAFVMKVRWPGWFARVRRFVAAASGIAEESPRFVEVTKAVCDLTTDAKQPLRGKTLRLRTQATKTSTGGDFTVHYFSPVG